MFHVVINFQAQALQDMFAKGFSHPSREPASCQNQNVRCIQKTISPQRVHTFLESRLFITSSGKCEIQELEAKRQWMLTKGIKFQSENNTMGKTYGQESELKRQVGSEYIQ